MMNNELIENTTRLKVECDSYEFRAFWNGTKEYTKWLKKPDSFLGAKLPGEFALLKKLEKAVQQIDAAGLREEYDKYLEQNFERLRLDETRKITGKE